ncbi:MAG: hypothetical protein IJT36_00580 [Alphaproteobacteria bacterium]|nr:hypothetical protein [Alphaproteobacteria bacterium]
MLDSATRHVYGEFQCPDMAIRCSVHNIPDAFRMRTTAVDSQNLTVGKTKLKKSTQNKRIQK